MHRVPLLVRSWHTFGELGRAQFRVLGLALAVDKAEQCRLGDEMLALEGGVSGDCLLWLAPRATGAGHFMNSMSWVE